MAMQHSIEGLRATGDPRDAERAYVIEGFLKRRGLDISFPSVEISVEKQIAKTPEAAKIYPEISLEEEWHRQVQGLVKLGFHTELGLTEEKYLESLPKFTPQPESFKGRLDTPVLVEKRISPKRQSELAGIFYSLDGLNVGDWDKDPKKYKTPDSTYAVWTDEGARFMDRRVQDVREELASDERGGTESDGIALYIAKTNILRTRFLDLPGTSVESDRAACLDLWSGRPGLNDNFVVIATPRFGSLVCGRQK